MNTLNAMRAGYGFARLLRPEPLADQSFEGDYDARAHTVDRVLGSRHLAQAIVSQAVPTARVLLLGAAVDLLHAASMLALAGVSRRRQSAALTEAVAALGFAAAGALAARHADLCPLDDRSATA
jgi:hypothetical protein